MSGFMVTPRPRTRIYGLNRVGNFPPSFVSAKRTGTVGYQLKIGKVCVSHLLTQFFFCESFSDIKNVISVPFLY